jgi:3-methyladenine DNA glycosylase AlkD
VVAADRDHGCVRLRAGDCDETLRLAHLLLDDEHDLIHKGVGWMLREVGKRDEVLLVGILKQHAGEMPHTMLRYAAEPLDAPFGAKLMAAKRRRTATVGVSGPGQNRSYRPSAR